MNSIVIPGTAGQHLIAYTAEPGSPSEAALRLLGSATAQVAQDPAAVRHGVTASAVR